MLRSCLLFALLICMSACGNKGPLVLPDQPAQAPPSAPTVKTTTPAPPAGPVTMGTPTQQH